MIIQTNIVKKGFDAFTCWPFIFIRPEYATNKGLIEHEMVHYKEQRACGVIPWLLRYAFSKKFRLAAELRGYKRQIDLGYMTINRAAEYLVNYGVDLSLTEAIALLRQRK